MNPSAPQIVICQCEQAKVLPAPALEEAIKRLGDAGLSFVAVPDLCELAARRDQQLQIWASSPVKIAACHPRAVQWLLAAAGIPSQAPIELINLREGVVEEQVAALLSPIVTPNAIAQAATAPSSKVATPPPGWISWFPVIDYKRCNQCMQCLGFCLFGVYGVDEFHNIQVKNPAQCKINCPACARVCPQEAILFPKHKNASINGQESPEVGAAPAAKLDISALLGGDAHALLRDRSARARNRFSRNRTEEEALSERRRHLAEQGMITDDIPPELLMDLPSQEVIAQKIEEAAARARAARKAREES